MAAVEWTTEQKKVIESRNCNILVSAAAGSGKTAVLVERIIQMVTDTNNPVDIDRLLIVTFTKAAAAEMRERIEKALEKKLTEQPDNMHLQKQMTLIHSAQITTIHSFCKSVIQNYFPVINLDPGVRLADEVELMLLKADVVSELLEDKYALEDEKFVHFIEAYSSGKTDDGIEKFILQLYDFSVSYPWPKEWLVMQKESFCMSSLEEMEQLDWMQFIVKYIVSSLEDLPEKCKLAMDICRELDGPEAYFQALESDYVMLEELSNAQTYEKLYEAFSSISWEKLKRISKKDEVNEEKQERVKAIRAEIKDAVDSIRKKFFFQSLQEMFDDILATKDDMCVLIDLAMEFYDRFCAKKVEKKVMDFNDLEHFALDILIENHDGEKYVYSSVADELSSFYEEIMIDEYQDSNFVQELLLTSISKERFGKPNIFMVGDVKQSIYKFRLARPELFMEKYDSYQIWTKGDSPHQRIDLHKNFRSREVVLEYINFVFRQIMQRKLGNIEYDKDAALYPGAKFKESDQNISDDVEVILVTGSEETSSEEMEETIEQTNRELEARAIARKIKSLMGEGSEPLCVFDGDLKDYRPVKYSDIVILLRTVSNWSEDFISVLMEEGIPAISDTQRGYFQTIEVQTVLNLLHIIDNPRQDIPLASVLHSPMFDFSSEDMALIRAEDREDDFYGAVKNYAREGANEEIRIRLNRFFEKLSLYRSMIPYTAIHKVIEFVLDDTGYLDYVSVMPGGEQRAANLDMLLQKAMDFEATSYKGLFQFNRYIEKLHKYDVDFGEALVSEDGVDAVRIMSIHKSKGLEFPVVFVSGMGKSFNLQDARSKLIVHEDLGLGADFINTEIRLKKPTLRKRAIQMKITLESLGEELRVLYVALTRAKEKLILTGYVKKLEQAMEKWQKCATRVSEQMDYLSLTSAGSYMSWVGPCLYYPNQLPTKVHVVDLKELVVHEVVKQIEEGHQKEELVNWDTNKIFDENFKKLIEQQIGYVYPFSKERDIPVKFTVTELKRREQELDKDESKVVEYHPSEEDKKETRVAPVPTFVKGEIEESPTARGTLYHKVMQELRLDEIQTVEDIVRELERMVKEDLITKEQSEVIQPEKILKFFDTKLGKMMVLAYQEKRLYRERPFVFGLPAKELSIGSESEEIVLIQGIIDAYIEEKDELILVDFKTDYVGRGKLKAFLEQYKPQMNYYQMALEKMTGKIVKKREIYSFYLNKSYTL